MFLMVFHDALKWMTPLAEGDSVRYQHCFKTLLSPRLRAGLLTVDVGVVVSMADPWLVRSRLNSRLKAFGIVSELGVRRSAS